MYANCGLGIGDWSLGIGECAHKDDSRCDSQLFSCSDSLFGGLAININGLWAFVCIGFHLGSILV